jgi:hypothetical protein
MSTLLERMVRRTRSSMPGIEPLVEPRYAPAAHFRQELGMSPANMLERQIDLIEEAPAHSEFSRRIHPEAMSPRKVNSGENLSYSLNSSRKGSLLPDPAIARTGPALGERSLDRRGIEVAAERARNPVWLDGTRPHSTRAASPVASAQAPQQEKGQSARTVAEPVAAAEQRRAELVSPPRPTDSQRQAPSSDVLETDRRSAAPDITISIGKIELRAAPATEWPRRPGFRPRVSLNDFLSQRNGDRP